MTAVAGLPTARLVLREFAADDWKAFQHVAADEAARRWGARSVTAAKAQAYVRQALVHQAEAERGVYEFAVCLKDGGTMIGEIDLGFAPGDRDGEVGFLIAKKHRNQGYAREALRALLRFAFGSLALERVYGYADEDNDPAAAAMAGAGMKLEERERVEDAATGAWRDALRFAAARASWR